MVYSMRFAQHAAFSFSVQGGLFNRRAYLARNYTPNEDLNLAIQMGRKSMVFGQKMKGSHSQFYSYSLIDIREKKPNVQIM